MLASMMLSLYKHNIPQIKCVFKKEDWQKEMQRRLAKMVCVGYNTDRNDMGEDADE